MRELFLFILLFLFFHATGQEAGEVIEQQETADLSETELEIEDDGILQQLEYYRDHPVDINIADPEILERNFRLSALQVVQFIRYRKLLGPFIDVMELQAVPGWEPDLIRQLLPFITVNAQKDHASNLQAIIVKGKHQVLLRTGMVLEKQAGYQKKEDKAPVYAGNPLRVLLKYSFNYNRQLQWGITAEKDAGEPFLRHHNKTGFDFYSFHFLIRRQRFVHTVIAGDFTINMGQGLIHWQGNAYKKSTGEISALRQGQGINAFKGINENLFHRGLGIKAGRKKLEMIAFGAWNTMDANLYTDALSQTSIRSWQQSGLHRTINEIQDQDAAKTWVAGFSAAFKTQQFRLGINGIGYRFNFPVLKKPVPENLYEISGKSWSNYSFDFRFQVKNHLFFGELAADQRGSLAFVSGLLSSLHEKLDWSMLYRNVSPAYRAIHGNAFTVGRDPENEKGLYTGLYFRCNSRIAISGYLDVYSFPWIKFRADGPSGGLSLGMQVKWKPDKKHELLSRFSFRSETDWLSDSLNLLQLPGSGQIYHFTIQSSVQKNLSATFRTRLDVKQIKTSQNAVEKGFMFYSELIYKKPFSKLSATARLAFFAGDGYRSGIGVIERDVLYNYSVQILYNTGTRYYLIINYKFNKYVQGWVKWMQTYYIDKQVVGAGEDLISGPRKTEIRLQVLINF